MARRRQPGEDETVPDVNVDDTAKQYVRNNVFPSVPNTPMYGTHEDLHWHWDKKTRRYVTSGVRQNNRVYGTAHWSQVWTTDKDIGTDYKAVHSDAEPLSEKQWEKRNEYSHRYDVISFGQRLGSGSFGTVWKVLCRLKNDQAAQPEFFACKIIKPNAGKSPVSIATMMKLLMDVNTGMMVSWMTRYGQTQPNLIPYLDVITIPDSHTRFPYSAMLILMPICQGDLTDILGIFAPNYLPHQLIQLWMNHICNGLKYLHDNDIVHLDIKPCNILVRFANPATHLTRQSVEHHMNVAEAMTFLLTDYGLAKMHLHGEGLAITQSVGTLPFMSRELILLKECKGPPIPVLTKPCDIYALGVTLFMCRTTPMEWKTFTDNRGIPKHMAGIIRDRPTMAEIDRHFTLLIHGMTRNEPNQRSIIKAVLQHPYLNPVQAGQAEQPNP